MKTKPCFFILLILFVALELIAAVLAFETMGEVMVALYLWVIGLNLLFVAVSFRYARAATIGATVLMLLLVPYQFWLGHRLWQLQNEAAEVVAYVYEYRLAAGEYPANLDSYTFENAALAPYFRYSTNGEDCEFHVDYFVGLPGTSHSYCPAFGWSYYPD